jgi:hypothetical protein
MIISEIDEATIDYDWFAVDDEELIGHFATGGCGVMPRSVTASAEDLQTITNFFRKEATAGTSARLSPTLTAHATFKSDFEKEQYLESYLNIASRGLFSFNALLLTMRPVGYFRVAGPVAPLRLELLPTNIRAILEKTRLKGISFRESDVIQLEAIQMAELAS